MVIQLARRAIFTGAGSAACTALAGLMALASPATVLAANQPAATGASELEEVVVTARRSAENLQDIPVSVQVVTGDSLQKQAMTSVEEISKLTPGLTLSNAGSNTAVVLRGVTWQPGSGTPATPIYLNDVPFDPAQTIVSMFDIGQIEVLRGPQGTTRGAPSISGAVTITTHKPSLTEFGGYVQGLAGSGSHRDFQGAVNFPVIKDKLAIRLAANIEDSDGGRIYSIHSSVKPSNKDRSYRATVLYKPIETLSFQAMYQQRKTYTLNYTQVAGPGSSGFPGFPGVLPAQAANFNGPALQVSDRASVQDKPSINDQHIDLLTFNASWEVLGQQLSYNYGRQYNRSGTTFNASDPLNILPGFENFTTVDNVGMPNFTIHEVRLSSIASNHNRVDYDLGWFSKHSGGVINFGAPAYLTGAFGNPTSAIPGAVTTPDSRYVLNSTTNIGLGQKFDSFYGNLRFHITDRTELAVGLAHVKDEVPVDLDIKTFAALNNIGSFPAFQGFLVSQGVPIAFIPTCEAAGAVVRQPFVTSTIYPGTCDLPLPNGFRNATQHNDDSYSDTLYHFSVSHKFTDNLLAYFTSGSSFRTGLPAINNPGLPANLVTPKPEKAKSYEIGVKATVNPRLRINGAIFQLDYQDQLTTFEGVSYYNTVTAATAQTSLAFYRNIDAKVQGVELEIAARPTDGLTLGGNFSYSKIKSKGGLVPCNAAVPAISATNPINFCTSPVGQVLNTQPPFQATINGGYEAPFNSNISGYVRFNASFQGSNPNFGNFNTGSSFKETSSYAIYDLFVGVTGQEGAWNVGLFAKNLFDEQVELNRVATLNTVYSNFRAAAGYDVVRTSRPREFGVTARYNFGTR
jgi:iron complex outermembrane receptor protein